MDSTKQYVVVPAQYKLSPEINTTVGYLRSKTNGKYIIVVVVGRQTFLGLDLSSGQHDSLLRSIAGLLCE